LLCSFLHLLWNTEKLSHTFEKRFKFSKQQSFSEITFSETRIFCTMHDTHGSISSHTLLTAELFPRIVSQFTCEVGVW